MHHAERGRKVRDHGIRASGPNLQLAFDRLSPDTAVPMDEPHRLPPTLCSARPFGATHSDALLPAFQPAPVRRVPQRFTIGRIRIPSAVGGTTTKVYPVRVKTPAI